MKSTLAATENLMQWRHSERTHVLKMSISQFKFMVFAFKPVGLGRTSWKPFFLSTNKRTKRIVS